MPPFATRQLRFPCGTVTEYHDAAHASDQATRFLARHLRVAPGSVVVEAGCGTGVLALLAARGGAGAVHATDVDPGALDLLRAAAAAQGLDRIVPHLGSLLEPLPAGVQADLVVALLPQKPSPGAFDVRYAGGADGADLLCALIEQAAGRLRPGGRLLLYHHSLAAPARVERALGHVFLWRTLAERFRLCRRDRYAALAPGILATLQRLVAEGVAQAWEQGPHLVWRARVIEACRRSVP